MAGKKTAADESASGNQTLYIGREMYKDLVKISTTSGVSMFALGTFIADLVVGAFERRVPDAALIVPKELELPKKPTFTAGRDKSIAIGARSHRKLKRFAEPLNMSISYMVEASWPYIKKAFTALPPARWANDVTMMNNVIGAAMRMRAQIEEDKVRKVIEAEEAKANG